MSLNLYVCDTLPTEAELGDACCLRKNIEALNKIVYIVHIYNNKWMPIADPRITKDFLIQILNDSKAEVVLLDSDFNEYVISERSIKLNLQPMDIISVLAQTNFICLVS